VASGQGRNCSATTATASRPFDLRNARRNRAFDVRARRSAIHLEKMIAQEVTENISSIPSTAAATA